MGRTINFLYDGPRPMGRGLARPIKIIITWAAARPIKVSEDGPWPGPDHHVFKGSRPGSARPIIFSEVSAQPGPTHHMAARPMRHGLYMGRPDNYVGRSVNLTGRPMCCSLLKGSCAYADVICSR